MIYIFIILLLLFLSYKYDYGKTSEGRDRWLWIVTIIFIILGGLHYRVGYDTPTYEKFYDGLRPLNNITSNDITNSRFAPGFIVLASFTKLFSPDMVLFNFIQSGFVCIVVTLFFKKNSRNPFFALLIFFIFMFTLLIFEQIREAISAGFFLLAWPFFRDKKWIGWFCLSFIATLFHTSATIMFLLPLIYLPGIKQLFVFGKRTIFICILIIIVAFAIQAMFFKYIQLLTITEATQELTQKYEDSSFAQGKLNIVGFIMNIFRTVLYPLLAMYFIGKFKKGNSDKYIPQLEIFALLSIYISLFSLAIPIVFRFNNYFLFFPILIMSDWIYQILDLRGMLFKLKYSTWILIFIPLFALQIYSAYFAPGGRGGKYKNYMVYYPYTSYIDKQKLESREKIVTYARRRM